MATADAHTALNELISSLDLSKVPDKLHCPGCHNFLANAFKTPCCDQAICDACQSSVQDQCPVCDHSPLTPDLCKPSKAVRTTAKAYLKTAEKRLADVRSKAQAAAAPSEGLASSVEPATVNQSRDAERPTGSSVDLPRPDVKNVEVEQKIVDQPQPSIEAPTQNQVPINDATDILNQEGSKSASRGLWEDDKGKEETEKPERQQHDPAGLGDSHKSRKLDGPPLSSVSNPNEFQNTMNLNTGLNNGMDYNQMMQFMSGNLGNGMANFNPMMAMPNMGMGPMPGMFGNLGGSGMSMTGMNGLNMGMNMNFNPNQGAFGGWHNGQSPNMWNGPQNNNPNAFPNGMGGDFGPNAGFGYNMSQPGNFHQPQYPNGDFQTGYHGRGSFRGRGRGRGGFRGRAGLNQNFHGNVSNNYQQPYEQQQAQIQQLQAQLGGSSNDKPATPSGTTEEQLKAFHDELAPGGQEEVDEALGVESTKPEVDEQPAAEENIRKEEDDQDQTNDLQDAPEIQVPVTVEVDSHVEPVQAIATVSPTQEEPPPKIDVPEAYKEDLTVQLSMPPPTAPLAPAAHFPDASRDHAFRGRGQGRFASRGRGLLHLSNGVHCSSKTGADPPFKTPTEPKGPGIVGAPTGPKAMRAAPITPTGPRGRGGGFQIVGRAAMMNKENRSLSGESEPRTASYRKEERSVSRSPSNHGDRNGRHDADKHYDVESDEEYQRRRERRHRRSKHDDPEDVEMQDRPDHDHSRSSTPGSERKSSHRHRDKDHHSSSTKHRSSHRSRRHREDPTPESYHSDEPSERRTSKRSKDRDLPAETESRSSSHREHHHRSSRSSRHDERDRDRDRDGDRDHEDRHRHRKRSRRDRDDVEEVADPDHDDATNHAESRHRSRRHKRDRDHESESHHGKTTTTTIPASTTTLRHQDRDLDRRISRAQAPTPTPSAPSTTTTLPEKDMHTLEREARNRERLLKEQQRRENAGKGRNGAGAGTGGSGGAGGSGGGGASGNGRRASYKYLDEEEAHERMVERERERDRWR